jgi:phosphatidylglycerophosphate synthase
VDQPPDRILTIPNAISVVRLCCIPLFLWLLFGRDNRHLAAWLLAVLGATDWVDGYIARRWNQVPTASSSGSASSPSSWTGRSRWRSGS